MVDLNAIFATFTQYGLIGTVALIAGWLAWDRDKKLQACQEARLADAKQIVTAMEQSTAVLNDVLEAVTKRAGEPT